MGQPELRDFWAQPPVDGVGSLGIIAQFRLTSFLSFLDEIEIDDEEMAEGKTDSGGILELKLPRKVQTGVRIREAPAITATGGVSQ